MGDVSGDLQQCRPEELKALFLFESLTDEQLAQLCHAGHIEVFDPGPVITEGDPVTPLRVLIDGELVLSKRAGGRELEIDRTSQPGVYFGARSAFSPVGHDRNRFSVRATRRTRFFVMPADEDSKPEYLEYDGDLYWLNINRRGELWINTKEKPRQVFRTVLLPQSLVDAAYRAIGYTSNESGGWAR